MSTNHYNTVIKQVPGASLVIDFSNSPKYPFEVILPNKQRMTFKTQTEARKFVLQYKELVDNEQK